MLQRLSIALAQIKPGNTSLYQEKEIAKRVYNNKKFNKVIKQNGHFIYEF